MTHRIDLIRTLLLHVEKHSTDAWIDLWISDHEEEAVYECVRLLERLGYFETVTVRVDQREFWKSVGFTAKGTKLLEAARNEASWAQAKEKATDLPAFLDSVVQPSSNDAQA